MNRDEMLAWQYAEEHPGYQREISPITPTAEDLLDADGQEILTAAQEYTDRENEIIRRSNERTRVAALRSEVELLRGQLREHGIEPAEYED